MNMINICTEYGFDILIISGSYGGHKRHTRCTTYNGRQATPGVWYKFPTGELKIRDKIKMGSSAITLPHARQKCTHVSSTQVS